MKTQKMSFLLETLFKICAGILYSPIQINSFQEKMIACDDQVTRVSAMKWSVELWKWPEKEGRTYWEAVVFHNRSQVKDYLRY
jgi:hypothetical protein